METITNSNGEYSFAGLARGEYSVTPTFEGLVFTPASRTLRVDSNYSGVNFYGTVAPTPAPSSPPSPITSAARAPHTVSGRILTTIGFGLGNITVTLVKTADIDEPLEPVEPPTDPGTPAAPTGGRPVPIPLLDHKRGLYHTLCDCWLIVPKDGAAEGYTSLDRNISLPEYVCPPGDDGSQFVIPALTYLSQHGVARTAIPSRLRLEEGKVDVTVLSFDEEQLQAGYYEGATVLAFEINWNAEIFNPDIKLSGVLGNARLGKGIATVELMPWPSLLASRSLGRTCGVLCDVGGLAELPDEEFGTHRCRNLTLQDGPDKDDWTALATVAAASTRSTLLLEIGANAISGNALHAEYSEHLEAGRVRFLTAAEDGGSNAGVVRDVKAGAVAGTALQIELIRPLPWEPQTGDVAHLTAGCRRTPGDCKWFNNYANFQGFDRVPGREGVLRRYTG